METRKEVTSAGPKTPEFRWIDWLVGLPDSRAALRSFSRHYHYFSIHQVAAFSRLLGLLPVIERSSLAILADVLHEELGRGKPEAVHSVLFERFARAVGTDLARLPLSNSEVVPGVRWYVCELSLAFGGTSLPRALATYQFLESSAVETYGPLLEALRGFGYAEADLEFFALHAEVEVEHARAAREMVGRANFTSLELAALTDQKTLLARAWGQFWADIHSAGVAEFGHA